MYLLTYLLPSSFQHPIRLQRACRFYYFSSAAACALAYNIIDRNVSHNVVFSVNDLWSESDRSSCL